MMVALHEFALDLFNIASREDQVYDGNGHILVRSISVPLGSIDSAVRALGAQYTAACIRIRNTMRRSTIS